MVTPVTAVVVAILVTTLALAFYQQRHAGRIYTGVVVWGVDLSGMTQAEARQALNGAFPYSQEKSIVLTDPKSGQEWRRAPAELGIYFDAETSVQAAYQVGRAGGPLARLRTQFDSWYYGHQVAPILVFDEGQLDQAIAAVAAEINRPAADASLGFDGNRVSFAPAQVGRSLDVADTRTRLLVPINGLRGARVQLLIHETVPRVQDTSAVAGEIQNIISGPMTLYLNEPLAGVDLDRVTVSIDELVRWIRIEVSEDAQGQASYEVFLDENALRAWLAPYEQALRRSPENARFYFDDFTRELVLVEPHVNGRALDVEATVAQFMQQVTTSNRSLPFVLQDVTPVVHSGVTAAELGITELVSESTTWFFGSTDERKHNIARSASNFYGIVVAPGQEFSFNHYLGEVSAEQGYETGLIIFGGRTIEGVGGGVCQVSTTLFQTAFWAGYPIVERWEHGYRVPYYDDGEGPGMDATVYSPLVDFRFINNTPYYLLIENYYNEANWSLTFKMYSTSLGRQVVKEGPFIENVQPPRPDIWELDEELPPGEYEQVDWAVEGADVTVVRYVYNRNGDLLQQDTFVSNYIPWQNIFKYGPGTELPGTDQGGESTPEPAQ
ncbi:MAG: VanW family protein [Chloroflexi bacterium]|nr:VanW family protein [Chloroflexota bacterium]MCI0644818.1 VanW family protein [Chloroflexota bacterium]MCI0731456.1 VanW family protein [Chloroflexota bacterium]